MTDVTAFAQNQRNEVRLLGDKAGALQAEPGMKQQTFLMQRVFNKSTKPHGKDDAPKYTEAEVSPTLNTFDIGETRAASVVVEGQLPILDDQGGSVMKVQSGNTMPTLRAQTHGHPPIVMQTGHTKGNGCGFNEDDVSFTLEAVSGGGQAVMDIFRLDPESSNSMKSDNPHSGCHREDVCHTLDTTPPNPAKGQGGMAIVEKVDVVNFQGNKGGCAVAQDEMFTLNAMHGSDVHVVGFNEDEERTCFAWKNRDRESRLVIGQSSPLAATDYKEPNLVGYEE